MDIFVSYTLRDDALDESDLRMLERKLTHVGEPFIDVLHNGGPEPQERVIHALRTASAMVVCATPGYWRSRWARLEWRIATRHSIPILCLDLADRSLRQMDWPAVRTVLAGLAENRLAGRHATHAVMFNRAESTRCRGRA